PSPTAPPITGQSAPTSTSRMPTSSLFSTTVTINGTNFNGATAVQFHGTTPNYTAQPSTEIQATVPANATTGSISVTTPGGTATSSSAFTVTAPPPTMRISTPTSGAGTSVSMTSGAIISAATALHFSGSATNHAEPPTPL